MYFLIDYENVNYAGLKGTEFLEKGDTISFFFSEKCDKIVGYRMMDIANSCCVFEICKLKNVRKNALDFYMADEAVLWRKLFYIRSVLPNKFLCDNRHFPC